MKRWDLFICPHDYFVSLQILNAFSISVFLTAVTKNIQGINIFVISLLSTIIFEYFFWKATRNKSHLYSMKSRVFIFFLSFISSFLTKKIFLI